LPEVQRLACCPRLATSIEYGVSYDNTSPSSDRSSSTSPLPAKLESGHANYCWRQTILSSSLSTDSHSAARTGSRSTLAGSAEPVDQSSPPLSRAARSAPSSPTVHWEFPTAWYNSFDTPSRLLGSHLQFCLRSVLLLRSLHFTDRLLANHGRCQGSPRSIFEAFLRVPPALARSAREGQRLCGVVWKRSNLN